MKGMLGFLEKAGLVKMDAPVEPPPQARPSQAEVVPAQETPEPVATPSAAVAAPLDLDAVYAQAGVAPSLYPAERLLRLVDGLSAMDEATRLMAIKAMDAADESWTIEDPLADAAAKVQALAMHAELLQLNLQALERDTRARMEAVAARREKVVGDIRQQMAELDALANRETTRAAQELATQEAQLKAAQDRTAAELASLSQLSRQFQGLSTQFGAPATPSQE